MSDQPKPTTGEWTVLHENMIYCGQDFIAVIVDLVQRGRIVDAHNAALAAEREIGGNTAIALAQQITKLEDQLAVAVEALKEITMTQSGWKAIAIAHATLEKLK